MNNGEKDMRLQMPTQAWITTFAVMDIEAALKNNRNISLKEYIDGQKAKINVWKENPEFPIYNIGFLFMMAYAFLVVPKEAIEKCSLNVSSDKIDELLLKMEIDENENNKNLDKCVNIIRHIRNSISHAKFDIVPNEGKIIFIDDCGKNITFNGKMEIDDFKSLLSEYYKTYYEIYHAKYICI